MLNSDPSGLKCILAFLAVALITGCRGGTEALKDGPAVKAAAPEKALWAEGLYIDEKTLSDHGFLPLWTKQPTEGAFHSAFLNTEGIFAVTKPPAGSTACRLIRYNLNDGLPAWIFELEAPLKYPPVAFRYGPSSERTRTDEVYLLQKDVMHCVTLQDGAELWRIPLPFSVSCAPVVDERQYYLGSFDWRIYAMAKNKPYPAWPYITGGIVQSPGAIGTGGQIYFTSTDKSVYRLEPTGWVAGRSWRFATGGRITGSPVYFSRWTFVGSSDYKLYCFEVDGTHAWEFPMESPIYGVPVVMSFRPDKPLVFCISVEERSGQEKEILWVLDAKTGQLQWRRDNVNQVLTIGKRAVYLLQKGTAKEPRRIVAVDALKGEELTSLPVEGFEIIPTNDADHGTNPKTRGTIFLISKAGSMQAIIEKP